MTKDDVKSRAPETGSSNSTPINFLVLRYLIAEPFDIHDSLLAFFALVVLAVRGFLRWVYWNISLKTTVITEFIRHASVISFKTDRNTPKTSVSFPSYNEEIVLSLHNFLQYRAKILSKGISSSRYGSSFYQVSYPYTFSLSYSECVRVKSQVHYFYIYK